MRIFGQSSTASRTSVSTRTRSLCRASRLGRIAQRIDLDAHPALDDLLRPGAAALPCACSGSRSRWISRSAPSAFARAPRTAGGRAGGRRATRAVSAAVTESTRNGMSSVTISIAVWRVVGRAARPAASARPRTRWPASSRCDAVAASRPAPSGRQLLVRHQPPVLRRPARTVADRWSARCSRARRLGDQPVGVRHRRVGVDLVVVPVRRCGDILPLLARASHGTHTPLAHHAVGCLRAPA